MTKPTNHNSNKVIISKFLLYLKKYWIKEILILVLILLHSLGSLSFPYFLKIIIDEVFPNTDYQLLFQIIGLVITIHIFSAIAGIISTYLQQQVSNAIMEQLRTDLFEHIIHLPISFFGKDDEGEVIHSLSREVTIIQQFLTVSLVEFINILVMIISISIFLLLLDTRLFLLCSILVPTLLLVTGFFHKKVRETITKDRKADASILSYMIDTLQNIILVKLSHQYQFEVERLRTKIETYIQHNLKVTLLKAKGNNFSYFIISMGAVIVIGFGSHHVFEGIITLGTLIAFLEYFNLILGPSRRLIGLYYIGLRAFESMSRIMSFFDLPILDEGKVAVAPPKSINKIACHQLHLDLGENTVLRNINLSFHKGNSYGIVGESGCGKSSLTFILSALYKPNKGKITLNGKDYKDFGIYAINQKVNLIRSTTKLINGTIRDNLLYGNQEKDIAKINWGLEITGLDEFIAELPKGLDTNISDIGTYLSDGQRQRLALARVLLKKPDVLILDEATSALDSISESKIIKSLLELYKDKMIILISHRLSAVKLMEEIICIENGMVVEQNNHQQLLSQRETYWHLFERQLNLELK